MAKLKKIINAELWNKHPKLTAALFAAAIGAILFVIIYGFRILNPANVDWLMESGDLSQHYYGWCFFRSSSWHFPIGLTSTLGYPHITSVMFTDSVPLFAIFFKLLSPILPDTFQYFGLWGIICFMLHGSIGALICLRFTHSKLWAVLGSMLFIMAPIVLQRLYYHSALAGHFLIYLGILLLISHEALKHKFKLAVLYWGLLGALCASIHQYFLPMCGVLCFGYTLYEILKNKRWYGFWHCIAFIAAALFVDYLLGAFSVNAHSEAGGLGSYSFNLNALFNPQGHSTVMPDLPTYNDQHEGFTYLGFGVIALLLTAFVIRIYIREKEESLTLKAHLRSHWVDILVYGLIAFICVVLAMSPIVTLGDNVLFTIPLPEEILTLWSVFRATGRLIWPVPYLITVFGLSVLLKRQWKWLVTIALALCVSLQLYDLSGAVAYRQAKYAVKHTVESPLTESFWLELNETEQLEHLILSGDVASAWDGYLYPFAEIALQNNWTLNNFYFARHYEGISDTWKHSLLAPADDMVFVLSPAEYDGLIMGLSDALVFYEIDGLIIGLCNPQFVSLPQLDRQDGYTVSFGDNEHLQQGEDIGGVRHLYKGGISYGPYIAALPGMYEVTVTGENLDRGEVDATVDAGSTQLQIYKDQVSSWHITYRLQVTEPATDLEMRVFNHTDETIRIRSITISPIGRR